MNKIKIVIADDIATIVENYKEIIIKNENIEIIGQAYNGEEELNMILNLKPDIVITDNQMPKMTGIGVIEKVVNMNIEHKPEFILITGDTGIELINKCRELNVFQILSKYNAPTNLQYVVDELISHIQKKNKPQNEEVQKDTKRKKWLNKLFKIT